MKRLFLVALASAALTSPARAAEPGQMVRTVIVCRTAEAVERHMRAALAAKDLAAATPALREDYAAGLCATLPSPVALRIDVVGPSGEFVDGDGDTLRLTVVGVGPAWTLGIEVVKRGSST